MQKLNRLPDHLSKAPFTLAAARASGIPISRLRRKDIVHVGRGLYRPSDWNFDLEAAARALSAASPGSWISHVTAARLHGQLLPPWLSDSMELHLSKPRALPSVRRKGVLGHTVLVARDEIEFIDGIRLSTRSRTWLDLSGRLSVRESVCMGDQLIRIPRVDFEGRADPFDTLEGLRALVGRHPNLQGVVHAREALDLMRIGSDSAPESLLRLAMADAGLPEPDLQVALRVDDPSSPTADLGYRLRRLAIQYDGEHHLNDAQARSDRRRDKTFEAAGWMVLIAKKDDLADGFQRTIGTIKRVLRTAWMDYPLASGFADAGRESLRPKPAESERAPALEQQDVRERPRPG